MTRCTQIRATRSAHILPAVFGVLLLAAGIGSAGAQSFDCRNARHPDEKAICQESRLGDLDKQLADAYDRAGAKLSKKEREAFENNETAFVNARHRCGGNLGCIEQSYRNRLQELLSAVPDEQSGRSDRRGDAKGSDRQKASRDSAKTEEVQTVPDDIKRDAGDAIRPSDRSSGQKEAVQKEPGQKEPGQKEPGQKEATSAAATVPNPPSRREAEAALSGQPPSEKPSRHKHRRESATVTPAPATPAPVAAPAPQAREEPPAASAPPATERHPRKSAAAPASERHQAAEGSTASESASPPEKKHSRTKHVASGTSVPSPTPADQAKPASADHAKAAPADQANSGSKPEIKWVNPAPSR